MVEYDELKKLVIVRLEAMPPNIRISLGGKDLSKEDLIKEVKQDSKIGKTIVSMQIEYLRSMKRGFA
jgi:hypothetical protein